MKQLNRAFTMIEVVFVIVILGILAAVAIPRLSATRTDAQISKGRADVSAIRSAIVTERQSRLIKGDRKFIAAGIAADQLDDNTKGGLFGGVLTYAITPKDSSGHWHTRAGNDVNSSTVKYKIGTTDVTFTYKRSDGSFTCSKTAGSTAAKQFCAKLID
jgi:general secretion pathway protein G